MSDSTIKLLIVDDEPATRALLTDIFSSRGHHVRAAEDGFSALRLIRDRLPDILLSDLNMPGMTGFELLSIVRRLYPSIHVIATSGSYSGRAVPQGVAADAFYEKATGLGPLLDLMSSRGTRDQRSLSASRQSTPIWIDLAGAKPSTAACVLMTCPFCLRAFRLLMKEADTLIRETDCEYCGSQIAYAIAMPVDPGSPKAKPMPEVLRRSTTLPQPSVAAF